MNLCRKFVLQTQMFVIVFSKFGTKIENVLAYREKCFETVFFTFFFFQSSLLSFRDRFAVEVFSSKKFCVKKMNIFFLEKTLL